MRIYLDICALKRPWDRQRDLRVASETAAVRVILAAAQAGRVTCVRSPAHDVENELNHDADRIAIVAEALRSFGSALTTPERVIVRAEALSKHGLGTYDALHLAWAEELASDVLATTDDRFIRRASRVGTRALTRIMKPNDLIAELPL